MSIKDHQRLTDLTQRAGEPMEGSANAAQREHLARLASDPRIRRIGEIGFNAGISARTFLEANPNASVHSFDLVRYPYWRPAKKLIDANFPGRHHLIPGDSTQTVPQFAHANPNFAFDLIFIDGGHERKTAEEDIRNMGMLAARPTILVVDDISPWTAWGIGPTEAWNDAIAKEEVFQTELRQDGIKIAVPNPSGSEKVWAVGGYNFGRGGELLRGPSL